MSTSEKTPSETPTESPTPTDVLDPLGAWTDVEVAVYDRVNLERGAADLGDLAPDDHLLELARTHTQAMIEWDRLAHEGPDGETHLPSSTYCSAATELLFGGQNTDPNQPDLVADQMVDLWMDSEGHRESILSPTYSHIGVGIGTADDTKFELYATMTLCLPSD